MARVRNVLVGGAAAILCYQLMLPPIVALADNGDFGKVIGRFDLWAKVNLTYAFSDDVYVIDHSRHWTSPFYSTEIPLTRAAIALNSLFSKDGNFDIRLIGAVHGALFLLALLLLAPLLEQASKPARWAVCGLVLLFYCDEMYAAGLNSFYMDEPAYLFLLLSIVFYIRAIRWNRTADSIGFVACAILMAASKSQHAIIALWIALLLALNSKILWPWRRRYAIAIAALPAFAAAGMVAKGMPADFPSYAIYDVVFEQILPHARNTDRTLADLGLDSSYRPFIGKNSYMAGSRMDDARFRGEFGRRLNLPKLARFYATHPRDAWQMLIRSLDAVGRQHAFGTFDVSARRPPGDESRAFRWWSDVKLGLLLGRGHRYFWLFVTLTAVFGGLIYLRRATLPGGAVSAGYILIGMTYTELAGDSLLDSMDVVRHHLIFYALCDAMLLATVAIAIGARTAKSRKPKQPEQPVRAQARASGEEELTQVHYTSS